jgi:hypothetical protein
MLFLLLTRNYLQPWYVLWLFFPLICSIRRGSEMYLTLLYLTLAMLVGIISHPAQGIHTTELLALFFGLAVLGVRLVRLPGARASAGVT